MATPAKARNAEAYNAEIVHLDARTARVLAGLAGDEAGLAVVAELIAIHKAAVMLSPQMASYVTAISVPTIRAAIDTDLRAHGRGKHRWVLLADLERWTGQEITVED